MKVLFVVTHLLGSGHLSRTLTLAHAFGAAGHEAVVLSGGMPAPHLNHGDLTFVQLPPLRSDGVDFTRLLDEKGQRAGAETYAARQQQILETLIKAAPDVLITELFPFGRRNLRNEFQTLLQEAMGLPKRPLILASIRDILAPPSKPSKVEFAQDMIVQHYDAVLVHADPDLVPLTLSWPVNALLQGRLRYTGFVAPPPAMPHPQKVGQNEVLVTAGGGDVGSTLFACASKAAASDPTRTWRLLIGGKTAPQQIEALTQDAPANVVVEAARQDFRQMLPHAAASISMCGYNTALDILHTSCPAVFVPFDAGNEVEQSMRAEALRDLPGIEVLSMADLTPETLRKKVDAVMQAPQRQTQEGLDGAAQSVEIVKQMLDQNR